MLRLVCGELINRQDDGRLAAQLHQNHPASRPTDDALAMHTITHAHHGRHVILCEHASSVPSIFSVVSATSVCHVALHASERAVSGYQYLTGSHLTDGGISDLRLSSHVARQ